MNPEEVINASPAGHEQPDAGEGSYEEEEERRAVRAREYSASTITTHRIETPGANTIELDDHQLRRYNKALKTRVREALHRGDVDERDALLLAADANELMREAVRGPEFPMLIPALRPVGPSGDPGRRYVLRLRSPRGGVVGVLARISKEELGRFLMLLRKDYDGLPDMNAAIRLLETVAVRFFEFAEVE